jgi:hypothetical protein
MEDAHKTYSHEYEVRRVYYNIGDEGTYSNGHREGKEERMNLVKTIKSLQKDVQSYKVDNNRLMKAKEEQDGFNIKLLQSLDKIEKKMDKEIESSKSRRHKSHNEGRKIRSVGRHHYQSPRHSARRAHNSSSPSPIKKHKRRSGVDELQGEMNKINPPTFDGDHKKDEDVKTC